MQVHNHKYQLPFSSHCHSLLWHSRPASVMMSTITRKLQALQHDRTPSPSRAVLFRLSLSLSPKTLHYMYRLVTVKLQEYPRNRCCHLVVQREDRHVLVIVGPYLGCLIILRNLQPNLFLGKLVVIECGTTYFEASINFVISQRIMTALVKYRMRMLTKLHNDAERLTS